MKKNGIDVGNELANLMMALFCTGIPAFQSLYCEHNGLLVFACVCLVVLYFFVLRKSNILNDAYNECANRVKRHNADERFNAYWDDFEGKKVEPDFWSVPEVLKQASKRHGRLVVFAIIISLLTGWFGRSVAMMWVLVSALYILVFVNMIFLDNATAEYQKYMDSLEEKDK